jgi:hypothetical protein
MRRSLLPAAAAFVLVVLLCPSTRIHNTMSHQPSHARVREDVYTPVPEDFQSDYNRDVANQQKQTWDEYWGWIQSFYNGNFLVQGWTGRARWLLADVKTSPALERLQVRVSAMGRAIASEWAKDSDVRRINSTDLREWGKLMEQGKERDEGSGAQIGQVIDAIESDFRQKVKPPAAKSP